MSLGADVVLQLGAHPSFPVDIEKKWKHLSCPPSSIHDPPHPNQKHTWTYIPLNYMNNIKNKIKIVKWS